jgi:hypothetical protein
MNSPMFYLFPLIFYPHFYLFPSLSYKCWKMQQSQIDYHCKNWEESKMFEFKCAHTMKKWTNLQLALQQGFPITMIIWNSLQLNAFLRAWMLLHKLHELQRMQLTICEMYTYATCATQLQLCKNNYYATLM